MTDIPIYGPPPLIDNIDNSKDRDKPGALLA